KLWRAAPDTRRRVLFHGDSITHGHGVTSPRETYVWQACERAGCTSLNYGFGGNAWEVGSTRRSSDLIVPWRLDHPWARRDQPTGNLCLAGLREGRLHFAQLRFRRDRVGGREHTTLFRSYCSMATRSPMGTA